MPHTVQYAIVGGSHIYDTHLLTAEAVRAKAFPAADKNAHVERYNRCPVCQEWTTNPFAKKHRVTGYLVRVSKCPAVKAEIQRLEAIANDR